MYASRCALIGLRFSIKWVFSANPDDSNVICATNVSVTIGAKRTKALYRTIGFDSDALYCILLLFLEKRLKVFFLKVGFKSLMFNHRESFLCYSLRQEFDVARSFLE